MVNPTGKKLEKLLFGIFDDAIEGVDTYNHNGSMWLIFTDEMRWVVEYTKSQTLWYNYYFFKQEMEIIGLDCVENKDLIQKWFESRFLNMGEVEDTIQNGVKKTHLNQRLHGSWVEDTIQNGVKKTFVDPLHDRTGVEDTIRDGVRETILGSLQRKHDVEGAIQNGIRETKTLYKQPELLVENTIQNGVKETKQRQKVFQFRVDGTIQNGVKHTLDIADGYQSRVEDTIQNGVKKIRWNGELGTHLCEDVIENGVKHTESLPENNPARIEHTIQNGIKEIKKWVLFNILKGKAHLLRFKHFLKTGRDIPKLPPPQKDYARVYFFEIENGGYVLKHHEIPISLVEKFDEEFSKKKDGLMGLTREQVVRWVIKNQK